MPRHSKRDNNGQFTTNGQPALSREEWIVRELVRNQLSTNLQYSRSQLAAALSGDTRRNISDECGYPTGDKLTPEYYRSQFDRDPIAGRVVELLPIECWKAQPEIFEDQDSATTTAFEEEWDGLGSSLLGESWHEQEEGSPVWEYLCRLDVMAGIGRYGVMLLGVDDGQGLDQPLSGLDAQGLPSGTTQPRRLLYLRVFDESLAPIMDTEKDPQNRRFGQPTLYGIKFSDPADPASLQPENVHWTRLIHVADGLLSSEWLGTPRMQPVVNTIHNLQKLYGGSAEMYWKGAFPGISIETHPQLGPEVQLDESALKDMMEQYMNTLQRYIYLGGASAKSMAPQVVDPTPQVQAQLDALCIRMACPKRVFVGSERGELASSQDARAWNDRLGGRQRTFITPRIIAQFINRLIAIGVLPVPNQGYQVEWPDMNSLSPLDQATVTTQRTTAMKEYVTGQVQSIMVPMDYLTRELGYTQEEAEQISEAASQQAEDKALEQEQAMADALAAAEAAGVAVPSASEPPAGPGGPAKAAADAAKKQADAAKTKATKGDPSSAK